MIYPGNILEFGGTFYKAGHTGLKPYDFPHPLVIPKSVDEEEIFQYEQSLDHGDFSSWFVPTDEGVKIVRPAGIGYQPCDEEYHFPVASLGNAMGNTALDMVTPMAYNSSFDFKVKKPEKKVSADSIELNYVGTPEKHKLLLAGAKTGSVSVKAATAYELLADYESLHKNAKEYKSRALHFENKYNSVVDEFAKISDKLEKLESSHFDIKQFDKFTKDLYKVFKVKGPEMKKATDLPKFIDYMFAVVNRSTYTEPELP
jgi:hypothetical protein